MCRSAASRSGWRNRCPAAISRSGRTCRLAWATSLAPSRPSSSRGPSPGTGKQWLAWIGLDDLLDVYLRAVTDPGLSGAVNAVAPEPVRNIDYTRTLAGVLRRPAVLPVPGLGPRLLLGREGAR